MARRGYHQRPHRRTSQTGLSFRAGRGRYEVKRIPEDDDHKDEESDPDKYEEWDTDLTDTERKMFGEIEKGGVMYLDSEKLVPEAVGNKWAPLIQGYDNTPNPWGTRKIDIHTSGNLIELVIKIRKDSPKRSLDAALAFLVSRGITLRQVKITGDKLRTVYVSRLNDVLEQARREYGKKERQYGNKFTVISSGKYELVGIRKKDKQKSDDPEKPPEENVKKEDIFDSKVRDEADSKISRTLKKKDELEQFKIDLEAKQEEGEIFSQSVGAGPFNQSAYDYSMDLYEQQLEKEMKMSANPISHVFKPDLIDIGTDKDHIILVLAFERKRVVNALEAAVVFLGGSILNMIKGRLTNRHAKNEVKVNVISKCAYCGSRDLSNEGNGVTRCFNCDKDQPK